MESRISRLLTARGSPTPMLIPSHAVHIFQLQLKGWLRTNCKFGSFKVNPIHQRVVVLVTDLLQGDGVLVPMDSFSAEQHQDKELVELIDYLERGVLPFDSARSKRIVLLRPHYSLVNDVLYLVESKNKGHCKLRAVVPRHLRTRLMEEHHRGKMGGHFSGSRMFKVLSSRWWWEGMHRYCVQYMRNCPECSIVTGGGKTRRPPLHPIPDKALPNYWSRYYGSASHSRRKSTRYSLSGLFNEVAYGVSSPRSAIPAPSKTDS